MSGLLPQLSWGHFRVCCCPAGLGIGLVGSGSGILGTATWSEELEEVAWMAWAPAACGMVVTFCKSRSCNDGSKFIMFPRPSVLDSLVNLWAQLCWTWSLCSLAFLNLGEYKFYCLLWSKEREWKSMCQTMLNSKKYPPKYTLIQPNPLLYRNTWLPF